MTSPGIRGKSSNHSPSVLVVTHGHWQGVRRIPHMLVRAGCEPTVLAWSDSPIHRSLAVRRFIGCERPPVCQATATEPLMEVLRRHLLEHGPYDWVLFGDDSAVSEIVRRRDEPWAASCSPVPASDEFAQIVSDKSAFISACARAGVRVPNSVTCRSAEDARKAAAAVGYPLMLKADGTAAGAGVQKVERAEDLEQALSRIPDSAVFDVQQFVEGRVGVTDVLLERGRLRAWAASYKACCWPGEYGPSCARRFAHAPGMEGMAARIGEITQFHGLAGFDWLRGNDGAFYVLEFHPRPTTGYDAARHAGVDFAAAIRMMLGTEAQAEIVRPVRNAGRTVYMYPQYMQRCAAEGALRDARRCVPGIGLTDVPWRDPRLAVSLLPMPDKARTVVRALRDALRRGG